MIGYLVGKISGMPFEQFVQAAHPRSARHDRHRLLRARRTRRIGFAACYSADPRRHDCRTTQGSLTLQDDPATALPVAALFISGGGGLCSTAADYLTFCRALLNGGELGGVRLLGPKTLKLMTSNHLPGGRDLPRCRARCSREATYDGIGFGLGFAVTMNPAQTLLPGSAGEYYWGGAASTAFWIDPAEELITIFMTQLLPSSAYPIRRELRTMVYGAITESNV